MKKYIIGSINLGFAVILSISFAVVLSYHLKNYQNLVSFYVSWQFLAFDPFATRLLMLCLTAMLTNFLAAAALFSSFFSPRVNNDIMVFSLSSVLWIVIFLAGTFAQQYQSIILLPAIALIALLVFFKQTSSVVVIGLIILISVFVLLMSFI